MNVNLSGFSVPKTLSPFPTLVELVAAQDITTLLPYQDRLRHNAGLFDAPMYRRSEL
jgi:hypothetical protein